jgi:hypothetical protein
MGLYLKRQKLVWDSGHNESGFRYATYVRFVRHLVSIWNHNWRSGERMQYRPELIRT